MHQRACRCVRRQRAEYFRRDGVRQDHPGRAARFLNDLFQDRRCAGREIAVAGYTAVIECEPTASAWW